MNVAFYGPKCDRISVSYKLFIKAIYVLVSYQVNFNNSVDNDENTAFMVILGMKELNSANLYAKHL